MTCSGAYVFTHSMKWPSKIMYSIHCLEMILSTSILKSIPSMNNTTISTTRLGIVPIRSNRLLWLVHGTLIHYHLITLNRLHGDRGASNRLATSQSRHRRSPHFRHSYPTSFANSAQCSHLKHISRSISLLRNWCSWQFTCPLVMDWSCGRGGITIASRSPEFEELGGFPLFVSGVGAIALLAPA